MWSTRERAEIVDRVSRALPLYYRAEPPLIADPPARRPPSHIAALAFLCVAAGLVVAFWVFPARPATFLVSVPIFPLFGAVALARWLGGTWAGWCSAALSIVAVAYFWLPSLQAPHGIPWLLGVSLTFACIAAASGKAIGPRPSSHRRRRVGYHDIASAE